jgi:hypothetical protein
MMASTTTKRYDLRPLRRVFTRRPRAREVSVPEQIRIPAPAASSDRDRGIATVARTDHTARCPACELRAYLSD